MTNNYQNEKEINEENKHPHFKKGIKMLKDIVLKKIVNKKKVKPFEFENKFQTEVKVKREELLTPLIYISRGNSLKRIENLKAKKILCSHQSSNPKTIENFKFTNLRSLIHPLNSRKNLKSMATIATVTSRRTSIKRRRSIFNFLHSKNKIPKPKLSISCACCSSNEKKTQKHLIIKNKKRSLTARMKKRTRKSLNLNLKSQHKLITPKSKIPSS